MIATSPVRTAAGMVFVLAVAGATSCQPTTRQRIERQLRDTGAPALHAVHTEELERVMGGLTALVRNRMPQELDMNQARRRKGQRIAEIAQAMAESADHIPDVLAGTELNQDQREIFIALAENLESECYELKALGEQQRLEEVPRQVDKIMVTCHACHSAFRVLPSGPAQ